MENLLNNNMQPIVPVSNRNSLRLFLLLFHFAMLTIYFARAQNAYNKHYTLHALGAMFNPNFTILILAKWIVIPIWVINPFGLFWIRSACNQLLVPCNYISDISYLLYFFIHYIVHCLKMEHYYYKYK